MMWIVRLALRRPYTFVVFAFLILILGVFSIESMPTDIFPNIDIPVVTVVWQYTGLSASQIADRLIAPSERGLTTTVNDIDHMESQSLVGVGVIKIFFHPHVNIASAVAEVAAISQLTLRQLPPGTNPPFMIQYNASSVPVLQLGLSGEGLNEQQLNDLATNTIRVQLATVEGAQEPFPYGGKQREIVVREGCRRPMWSAQSTARTSSRPPAPSSSIVSSIRWRRTPRPQPSKRSTTCLSAR
jgi:multidrug efflux pump subunit AcrB